MIALEDITVDMMIRFLNECRDRGMGNAKFIIIDSNDEAKQASSACIQAFREDDEGDLREVDGVTGKYRGVECVCIY